MISSSLSASVLKLLDQGFQSLDQATAAASRGTVDMAGEAVALAQAQIATSAAVQISQTEQEVTAAALNILV